MAIIETTCSHCHRQAQVKLVARISDGPRAGRAMGHTGWARSIATSATTSARISNLGNEAKRQTLLKDLQSAASQIDKIKIAGELAQIAAKGKDPIIAAFAGKCSFVDCGGPILLIGSLDHPYDVAFQPTSEQWAGIHVQAFNGGAFELATIYPVASGLDPHPAWPQVAKEQLPELVEDLNRNRSPSRILAGARTVLDTMLKDLLKEDMPNGRGAAIRLLHERGIVTESIAEWSKKLWKDGSDASHDGSGDRARATAYLDFLKVLLRVAYVLPHDIEALKAKEDAEALIG
ncbi:hypothetical protein [Caulobacter sp. 17J65-9]|uniref:hypothetical protein n=1 Tax=Caulobacter sp. 17J65-9 TaxID=2709382 RepID=UPI0013CA2EE6|nr:hypothetical protein [Caulobacter sp. 17J65-9]NEX92031.1 hypothetical protein [Caulobacter sp. 17J65-9]